MHQSFVVCIAKFCKWMRCVFFFFFFFFLPLVAESVRLTMSVRSAELAVTSSIPGCDIPKSLKMVLAVPHLALSFWRILLKLYSCFKDGLKICILFFQNPEIIFYHFLRIFNLDIFQALILQICIWSMYLYRQLLLQFLVNPFETLQMF